MLSVEPTRIERGSPGGLAQGPDLHVLHNEAEIRRLHTGAQHLETSDTVSVLDARRKLELKAPDVILRCRFVNLLD